ncbi:hypothetical protein [Lacipirellula sp.]|uniref:hypothetical protein n=1 Tax=Lacipirellula sp. TaxID=2691419 RepID=UPI003D145699
MAPIISGEDGCFANAFNACADGLKNVSEDDITEPDMIASYRLVKEAINVDERRGQPLDGLYVAKSRAMSVEELRQFSDAVDSLATWFLREELEGRK